MSKSGMRKQGNQAPLLGEALTPGPGGRGDMRQNVSRRVRKGKITGKVMNLSSLSSMDDWHQGLSEKQDFSTPSSWHKSVEEVRKLKCRKRRSLPTDIHNFPAFKILHIHNLAGSQSSMLVQ